MITVIVPCYNEKKRLPVEDFKTALLTGLKILFVDDGSSDGTADWLKQNFNDSKNVSLLRLEKNCGKAEAVRQGILHLQQNDFATDSEWIGFWDADLSTPLTETTKFLTYQKTFAPNAGSIWGSRVYRLGADIRRSARRHYLGRLFATIIAHVLKIEAYDTQCGAKLFRPEVAQKAFGEPFISSWIFDVEILLRIGQKNVVEYPVEQWHDVSGSKVKILKEVFRVTRDIFRIRKRYLTSGPRQSGPEA